MIARLNRTPHATADAEGRKSYMRFLPPLLAAVAAALVFFAGVTTGHISMDDWGYIYGCPFVRDGLSAANVAAAFSQFGYDAFWMPLTFISYMADITFFGGGWAVHHAVCVAIHAANAALAFVLLKRLASVFAPEASPRETALACLAAALFWALHPMRAEAVVYIAARKDLLWTFFALLGLIAWTRHIRRGDGVSLALTTACCLLACLSKPTAVCFPFLALALEWAALGRFPRRLWRYAPMLATAVLVGAITLYCQSNPIDHERLDVFGACYGVHPIPRHAASRKGEQLVGRKIERVKRESQQVVFNEREEPVGGILNPLNLRRVPRSGNHDLHNVIASACNANVITGGLKHGAVMVSRAFKRHSRLAAVYARTGNPLEYFGLKCGDSHDLILPTLLNASASPYVSIDESTCSN